MLRWEQYTIAIPRNGYYQQDWQIKARSFDLKSWEPVDLTGHMLSLSFKKVAGQGSIISSADLDVYDPANGWMTVTVDGSSFSSVDGQTEIVTLAYDLKDIDQDGVSHVYPRGHALLIPGVS